MIARFEDVVEHTVRHSVRRWLAPSFAAFLLLLHPLLAQIRPEWQVQDPGTAGHLAVGRVILATGTVPSVDTFSFTAAGRPWIDYNWLFDLGAAWLERLGGLPLFTMACTLIYAFVPVVLYRWMLRTGAAILPALLCTFLAYLVLWSHALARPHVVTYLLFAVFLGRMDDVWAGRRTARSLWLLPPLAALWCNVHGGFVLAFVPCALFAASAFAAAVVARDPRGRELAVAFAALLVLMGLATLANPFGWRLHADILRHVRAGAATVLLDEWKSPDFHTVNVPILAFETIVLGMLLALAYARERLPWTELLLVLLFLHAALQAVRNLSLFAIVATPVLARIASVEIDARFPAFAHRWRTIAREQAELRSSWIYLPTTCAVFLGLAVAGIGRFPRSFDGAQLTPGAAAFIAAHPERFTRPFNTDNLGGALLERFWPAVHVFVDDRVNAYDPTLIRDDYVAVLDAAPRWRDVLARWDVTAAVVDANAPCAAVLGASPEWSVAFADERNAIFLRTGSPDTARRSAVSAGDPDQRRALRHSLLGPDHPGHPFSSRHPLWIGRGDEASSFRKSQQAPSPDLATPRRLPRARRFRPARGVEPVLLSFGRPAW